MIAGNALRNRPSKRTAVEDERGQGLVEYALILALVSLAAIVALGFLSGKINALFSKAGNSLNTVAVADSSGTGGTATGGTATGGGDTTPPTVSSVGTGPDDNDGRVENGDTIVIVFSEALNLSTLCPGGSWSGGALNNTANVDLNNNGNNDTITVATAGGSGNNPCTGNTFNFGTLALGGNFLSNTTNRTFEDSTISWNSGSNTLTIALGGSDGDGDTEQDTSSTMAYTPHSGVTDVAGNAISGTGSSGSGTWF